MSVVLPLSRRDRQPRSRRSVLLETSLQSNTEAMAPRQQPNVLITGTPGTGKTTHAELIASEADLKQLNIGELVREHELHDGFDDEHEAYTMNDDKVRPCLRCARPGERRLARLLSAACTPFLSAPAACMRPRSHLCAFIDISRCSV